MAQETSPVAYQDRAVLAPTTSLQVNVLVRPIPLVIIMSLLVHALVSSIPRVRTTLVLDSVPAHVLPRVPITSLLVIAPVFSTPLVQEISLLAAMQVVLWYQDSTTPSLVRPWPLQVPVAQ